MVITRQVPWLNPTVSPLWFVSFLVNAVSSPGDTPVGPTSMKWNDVRSFLTTIV